MSCCAAASEMRIESLVRSAPVPISKLKGHTFQQKAGLSNTAPAHEKAGGASSATSSVESDVLQEISAKGYAYYLTPCAGEWGIVRGAMAVPELVLLFVAPTGCSRHGSVCAMMNGYRERVFYLDASEEDLVMGTHLDGLDAVVDAIMQGLPTKPAAFFLFSTCVDDLLGSDYRSLAKTFSKRYGIPFVDGHMDPISLTSSAPPLVKLQRSIYEILEQVTPGKRDESAVNIIGPFAQLSPESDLIHLLHDCGYTRIRQLPSCKTFEDFAAMRNSALNIVMRDTALLAAREMERKLGIPFVHAPAFAYTPDVARVYDAMAAQFKAPFNYQPFLRQAQQACEQYKPLLQGKSIGIGASLALSPFEAAVVFLEAGMDISFIICAGATKRDEHFIDMLCAHNPNLPVYPAMNPVMSLVSELNDVDVAFGFDAARLCTHAPPVSWGDDVCTFGFSAIPELYKAVYKALTSDHSTSQTREMLYQKALVI